MTNYSLDTEVKAQGKMILALQSVLAYVLSELSEADPKLASAIKAGFENAILSGEVLAMREGQVRRANPD
jgi:hypothetical protein